MTAALRLVEEPDGRPETQEAVEELLADNYDCWKVFEGACRSGVLELRECVLEFRTMLMECGHRFASHAEQFEEVFEALLAVAEELLPESLGAARGRLRERVRDDVSPRPEGGVSIEGDVDARRAVEVVLAHEYRLFDGVVLAAGCGHARLYSEARRVRDGLAKTGRMFRVEEVEDELWIVVREFFPDTPAAIPNTARVEDLWARAQAYVEENDPDGAVPEKERGEHEIRALAATKRHDPPGLRAALREMCRTARDAAREAKRNEGDEGDGDEG